MPLTRERFLRVLGEGVVVTILLAVAGYFYLWPAAGHLLRGNAAVMVGDGGDSVTNVWAYQLVLDVAHQHPQDLFFNGLYSAQLNAPEGAVQLTPWIERLFVLAFSPFMRVDLMPTAMAWALMVLSGTTMHAYGRVVGFSRGLAFALAFAWAFCSFTRARAAVHIAFDGTYFLPAIFMAVHLLARPHPFTRRVATVIASALLLFAAIAIHYFVIIAAILAPAFVAYLFVVLPRSGSRSGALVRLGLSALPAILFVASALALPAPSYATRALRDVRVVQSSSDDFLHWYGARPLDYLAGDVKYGPRDLVPLRERITRQTQQEEVNRHERSNGIRWSVLLAWCALVVALLVPRWRRLLSRDERRLGRFACWLGLAAFLLALSPQGLQVYGVELGPVQLVAKLVPRYRVPNRMGIVVHFAALVATGVLVQRLTRRRLTAASPASVTASLGLVGLMVLDFPPLNPVQLEPIVTRRADLEASAGPGACGYGLTLPYTTWGFHDEDYYRAYTSLRGTSCKILHAQYLTAEAEVLRQAFGKDGLTAADGDRFVRLARCSGASWVMFRRDEPRELRESVCRALGWVPVADDACRAAPGVPMPPVRALAECAGSLDQRP